MTAEVPISTQPTCVCLVVWPVPRSTPLLLMVIFPFYLHDHYLYFPMRNFLFYRYIFVMVWSGSSLLLSGEKSFRSNRCSYCIKLQKRNAKRRSKFSILQFPMAKMQHGRNFGLYKLGNVHKHTFSVSFNSCREDSSAGPQSTYFAGLQKSSVCDLGFHGLHIGRRVELPKNSRHFHCKMGTMGRRRGARVPKTNGW